ncbi:MAG: translation elongation factor 4 [Candidatus Omnitrophica bacterium]|nr:translation elongation factor 4 [Candidatus Omnitrophota bacterium]
MHTELVRNFSIIAHIDHGKSTLADRFLLYTGAITEREFRDQILDDMELEREKGITIKASAVRLFYNYNGKRYELNLIDTPGHVDFTSEVTKAIACSEGALLVVDASQGVEAQTVANLHYALEKNLAIIPVINKIDLPNARVEEVEREIKNILQIEEEKIIKASAKEGIGIKEILVRIVKDFPPPEGNPRAPLKAMVFDSYYDVYRGVVVYVRVFEGKVKPGDKIKIFSTGREYEIEETGVLTPYPQEVDFLQAGDVGFIIAGIKNPREVIAGDTITLRDNPASEPLPGFKRLTPMVYAGFYPVNSSDFSALRSALEKLSLTDSALVFEPENSQALGPGFRCGFLGLLHMEIIQERLEREYGIDLVVTTPNVKYIAELRNGDKIEIEEPVQFPEPNEIKEIQEPYVRAYILVPPDAIGSIMELAQSRRGVYKSTEYYGGRVAIIYELPLAEIIVDFHDRIKSLTRGYGSLDYELIDYRRVDLVKVDILLNGKKCDALSLLLPKDKVQRKAHQMVSKLKELIPRQLFEVVIQAAIGSKVIARENIPAIKKHVTGKCYGGDITRKRKLWERQKAGKKRMKKFGQVDIPQEAFLAILKLE